MLSKSTNFVKTEDVFFYVKLIVRQILLDFTLAI